MDPDLSRHSLSMKPRVQLEIDLKRIIEAEPDDVSTGARLHIDPMREALGLDCEERELSSIPSLDDLVRLRWGGRPIDRFEGGPDMTEPLEVVPILKSDESRLPLELFDDLPDDLDLRGVDLMD